MCFLAVVVSTIKVDKSLMNDDGVARAVHEHNSLFCSSRWFVVEYNGDDDN